MDSILQWLASSPPAIWLQALGGPIIGVAAVYVAHKSASTARNKLKFDMFEKRLHAYQVISELLSEATKKAWFTVEAHENYRQLKAQAKFLFSDSAIDMFLEEANLRLDKLSPPIQATLHPNSQQASELKLDRQAALINWRFGHISRPQTTRQQQERENPWLQSVGWLEEHATQWDELTLPYLRVSH